ncbi:MAG: site-specific integrase [Sphingomonadaceae bacterium]|nr:site-specific integrase [Sphingomonadaceae bacterium]
MYVGQCPFLCPFWVWLFAHYCALIRSRAVPLSRQVKGYLERLAELTGRNGYVFPSVRSNTRSMSENTLNAAFRRMGFTSDEVTAHGLRSTASTLLNESGRWNPDAIERALAHGDSNAVRGAYHRGTYWAERVEMAQWWSNYLEELKNGNERSHAAE